MPEIWKPVFRKVRAYPLVAATVVGTLMAGVANTGRAVEELKSLWSSFTYTAPRLDTVWQGTWKDRAGFKFNFAMQLEVAENDSAVGRISWQLVETPPNSFIMDRIGAVASEYVSGHFDRKAGIAELIGNGVSDPTLLATDNYRFQILDRTTFTAVTKHRGDWEAAATGTVVTVTKR